MDGETKHVHTYKLIKAINPASEQTWMVWKSPLPGVWQQLFHSTPAKPIEGDACPDTWTPKAPASTLDPHCVKRKDHELPPEPGWDEEMVYRTLEQGSSSDSSGWRGRVHSVFETETLEELLAEIAARASGHLTILNPMVYLNIIEDQSCVSPPKR
jgi:hypothetical protein